MITRLREKLLLDIRDTVEHLDDLFRDAEEEGLLLGIEVNPPGHTRFTLIAFDHGADWSDPPTHNIHPDFLGDYLLGHAEEVETMSDEQYAEYEKQKADDEAHDRLMDEQANPWQADIDKLRGN